ncbi:retinol dehydrogenase 11 [Bicyclus anynana]|uniref:Retinol dehydrogenase 11 n=1 Tax=Bicyclus anynana TaxID=110368 RepID=A0A6J1NCW0_BICAN|nr:retinol dehydrogenase 11 [Bicyclus anynana]
MKKNRLYSMRVLDDFTNCESNVRLDGKVALVTGATSGTGLEIAKNLARRGAKVIIASRNPAKLETARNQIIQSSGNENVDAKPIDFESLKSIRNFAYDIRMFEPKLNILINNIGAIGLDDRLTGDNLHTMMQVNYFGAFLLTFLLFRLMKASAPSRIVNVSSLALILGKIEIDHMNDVGRYSNFSIYCNAKLADVLFTVEMDRRVRGSGVSVYSMDPGLGKSQFFRNYGSSFWKNTLNCLLLIFGRPLHRVAIMSVFLAIDLRVERASGKHFRDCHEFYSSWFANDTILTAKLWEESKRLVGITPKEDWERF